MAILSRVLGCSFEIYLGELNHIYSKAKQEENSNLRQIYFMELAEKLITTGLMLPLWSTQIFNLLNKGFKIDQLEARYSPRLIDVILND